MRNLDEIGVDPNPKWNISSTYDHILLRLYAALRGAKKKGIDITNFNNVKHIKVYKGPIKFSDYCEVICNYDEYEKEAKRIYKELFRRSREVSPKSLDNARYRIPYIYEIIERIHGSENVNQKFYDELYFQDFRLYIEWMLSDLKSPIKYESLKKVKITENNRFCQFKNMRDLVDILLSDFLTLKEKQRILNIQYTLFYTFKQNNTMLKSILNKEPLVNVPRDIQVTLFNEWTKRNEKKGFKTLKKFKRNIII